MAALHGFHDQHHLISSEVLNDSAATIICEWRPQESAVVTSSEPDPAVDPQHQQSEDVFDEHKEALGEDDGKCGDYTDLYMIGSQLGEGGFGSVYAGFRIADGVQVALKFVDKEEEDGLLLPAQRVGTPMEVGLMTLVNRDGGHQNILQLYEWMDEPEQYIMVLERPDKCMDLTKFMASQNGRLSEQIAKAVMRQLLLALLHCQNCGVFHRDVKPNNVLIEPDTMRVILIDFGCGDLWSDTPYTTFAGTEAYAPPELFGDGTYLAGPATVWSVGITLYKIVCGFLPFYDDDEQDMLKIHYPEELSLEIIDFINCCLEYMAEDRATLEELNVHDWFRPICAVPEHKEALGEDDEKCGDYTDLYMIGSQLGEGGFGSVYAGFRIADGVQVALKFVEKPEEDEQLLPAQRDGTPMEVGLMTLVNRDGGHQNILQLYEWINEPEQNIMVLERPDKCMDLTEFMASQNGRLSEQIAKAVTRQLLLALLHCQNCGVFHRDVKPNNVLIEPDTMRVILIDFGCGDLWRDTPYTTFAGTEAYAPPELFGDGTYLAGPATVWSVGITLYEIVCGFLPFYDDDEQDMLKIHYPEELSLEIIDFINCCLEYMAEDRATLEELNVHDWFRPICAVPEHKEELGEDDGKCGDYTDLYMIGSQLGEGGFGSVYAGFRIADGVQVALKFVDKEEEEEEDGVLLPAQRVGTPMEVGLMTLVNRDGGHQNILQLYEWIDEPEQYIMVLERPDKCMDLIKFMASQNGRLSEQIAKAVTRQLLLALLHCQNCGVFHRDVKPNNVLIEPDTMRVILIDFGCGDLWRDTPYTTFAGTEAYAPPELFGDGTYLAGPVTVWSVGITLYEIVCGFLPFYDDDEQDMLKIHYPEELSLEIIDFINCCLEYMAEDRATLEELNVHDWFRPICAVPEHKEALGEDDEKCGDYTDLYMIGSQLGEGGFGSVYAGFRIADGVQVALKFVEKPEEDEQLLLGQRDGTPMEVGLMTLVNRDGVHQNILQLYEWIDEPEQYIMVLERPDKCMDLTKFMASQNGQLSEQIAKAVTRQLLLALLHCQKCGVFHRDVKPNNVLIELDTMRIILIDFGCGDLWRDTPYTTFAGTKEYAPPEWFADGTYHADHATVWSVGITLYELVCGFLPSDCHNMQDSMDMLPTGLSSEILHFIRWCLAPRVVDRYTLEELLDHQWFYSVSPTPGRTTEQERQCLQMQKLWMDENLGCSSFSLEFIDNESADGGAQITQCVWEKDAEERWIYSDDEDTAASLLAAEKRKIEDREKERQDCEEHGEEHGEGDKKYVDYTDLYKIDSLLGEGGFGSVYAGFRIADGVQVALKFVEKPEEDEQLLPAQRVGTPTEVGLMTLVNRDGGHQNILQLYEWIDEPEQYIMVLERPDKCMDLTEFMASQNGRLSEQIAKAVTRQLLLALLHCQNCGVFHRDVKPNNVLIEPDTMRVILIDFGCGDLWRDTPYTTFAGTMAYAPPEWFADGTYHADPATVWSVGITLYELVCGFLPSDCHNMQDSMDMLPTGLSSEILHFIRWCLAPRVVDRYTLEELLDHQWFYSVSPTPVRTTEQERQFLPMQKLWLDENLGCSSFSLEFIDNESADGGAQITQCVWEKDAEERRINSDHLDSAASLLAAEKRKIEDREKERQDCEVLESSFIPFGWLGECPDVESAVNSVIGELFPSED